MARKKPLKHIDNITSCGAFSLIYHNYTINFNPATFESGITQTGDNKLNEANKIKAVRVAMAAYFAMYHKLRKVANSYD